MDRLATRQIAASRPQGRGTLETLAAASRDRLIHFIVSATLSGGATPAAVAELYADLADDPVATRYVDERFVRRAIPPGWREVEDRVLDLQEAARGRAVDLAAAWLRARDVAPAGPDALEQLSRLAGVGVKASGTLGRSIFDDPEDLDSGSDVDLEAARRLAQVDRAPDLVDLAGDASERIRRFAIEERLERGLPAVELLDLYRWIDEAGDARARQYLDRVFVQKERPADWEELRSRAGEAMDIAAARRADAGAAYADVFRGTPGIDPAIALQQVIERFGSRS